MYLSVIFVLSGLAIAFLIIAKRLERKSGEQLIVFELISRGDRRVRDLAHAATRRYSEFKERAEFFIKKQLPLHSKSLLNKSHTLAGEKTDEFLAYIRNSKLLKKPDGLSEFFKNLDDFEKGNGEISDDFDYSSFPSQKEDDEVK